MIWTYEQATGRLLHGEALIATGYSGNGEHKNNPASQGIVMHGPLPAGRYSFGPPECLKLKLDEGERCVHCHGVGSHKHGPFVMRLRPDDATRKFILSLGRAPDSFLLHGDSILQPGRASDGCLIFPQQIRRDVWASPDHELVCVSGI